MDPNYYPASPFWPGRSPLRDLNPEAETRYIRVDPAHTFAIDGIGKSYLGSCIVALALAGHFGGGNVDCRFQTAYSRFTSYCQARGKTTSIDEFSYKTLKLPQNSFLSWKIDRWIC